MTWYVLHFLNKLVKTNFQMQSISYLCLHTISSMYVYVAIQQVIPGQVLGFMLQR